MNKYDGTFTLAYGYSGNLGTGYTLTTPTAAVLESILTSAPYSIQASDFSIQRVMRR